MTWLLIFILAVSLYDWRTRRIPNWCTLPVILAGMIAQFPGFLDLWLACFLLVATWAGGLDGRRGYQTVDGSALGAAQLQQPILILLIFISFLLTGFAQMTWRILRNQPTSGVKSPSPRWRVPARWSTPQ